MHFHLFFHMFNRLCSIVVIFNIPFTVPILFQQQDLNASTFVEFEQPTIVAAEEMRDAAGAEGEETAEEAEETASASLTKCRRLEGTSFFIGLSPPLLSPNF